MQAAPEADLPEDSPPVSGGGDGPRPVDWAGEVIRQMSSGVLVLDAEGKAVYVNPGAARILDRKETDILHAPVTRYFGRTSRVEFEKHLKEVRKTGAPLEVELNMLNRRNKTFPVELFLSKAVPGNAADLILAEFRDISSRSQKLFLRQEEDKMKALQHFISGAAHEIHHPIKGVMDTVQALVEKYQPREFEYISFREYQDILQTLETMRDQVRYCFDTTSRMISMNKKRVGTRQSHCDPNAVLTETVSAIRHQFELTKISIRLNKKQVPAVALSQTDLGQVLQNILTNALQSMPAGGVIQIKTAPDPENSRVVIECRDNGVGIPKEVIARVFEPFFTTKHRGVEKSSGLGLSIVYSIVKACHGEVEIKSDLRKGTLVRLALPLYRGRRQRRPRTAAAE
jgi:signal transduction histidine kinase